MYLRGLDAHHHLAITDDRLLIAGVGGAASVDGTGMEAKLRELVEQAVNAFQRDNRDLRSLPSSVSGDGELHVVLSDAHAVVFYTHSEQTVSFTCHRVQLEIELGVGGAGKLSGGRFEQPGALTPDA